jgi:hypothetical protein
MFFNKSDRASTASTIVALALLSVLFVANCYRAATQSITTDEALTFVKFVAPHLDEVLAHYDANNHVLNTALAWVSVGALGSREFPLRLPSVLGGALYLWGVYRLARLVFGAGPFFLAAVGLSALNPLLLDHLSAARGYGLALAFLIWALIAMIEFLDPSSPQPSRKLELAAVCLGLCVAANLAFLYPALALGAAFLITLAGSGKWQWNLIADGWIVPGVVAAFVFLVLPLNHVEPRNFYFGAKTLDDAVTSLMVMSTYHNPGRQIFLGFHPNPFALLRLLAPVVWVGVYVLILAGIAAAARILFRREQRKTPADSLLVLCGLAMAFIVAAIIAANHWFGVPYPLNRTALYWIPLSAFTSLALARKVGWRPLTVPVIAIAALLSAQYLCEFNVRIYSEWWDQAGSRRAMQAIRRDAGSRNIRIGVSDTLETILNFYRARHHIENWAPVERRPLTESYDYYFLGSRDAKLVDQRHLTVLYRDFGLIVAR